MCKNSENGAKWPILRKVRTGHARWRAQWPAVQVRKLACSLAGGTTTARANCARAWGRRP